MGNLSYTDIVRQVRLTVHDPNPLPTGSTRTSPVYQDEVYYDKVRMGINKLNIDLKDVSMNEWSVPQPPWTVETLPEILSVLLIKLAAMEMCQLRMTEYTNTSDIKTDEMSSVVKELQVPNLTVRGIASDEDGPRSWYHLWKSLLAEYDKEIARLVSQVEQDAGTIHIVQMQLRDDPRRRYPYKGYFPGYGGRFW